MRNSAHLKPPGLTLVPCAGKSSVLYSRCGSSRGGEEGEKLLLGDPRVESLCQCLSFFFFFFFLKPGIVESCLIKRLWASASS